MMGAKNIGRSEHRVIESRWHGARLHDIITQSGLRQNQVAALITREREIAVSAERHAAKKKSPILSAAMISQWISDKRTPDADDIHDICVALHIEPNDLYQPIGTAIRWQGGLPQPVGADLE